MQGELLLGAATGAAERGWVPDRWLRWGIRRLCRERLREQEAVRSAGDDAAALASFVAACAGADIAVSPDKANEQHYEVPADLFRLMLGPRMKYSSCWWDEQTGSLAEAEANALRLTAEHAHIEDGMRILELGCGWGSLSLWLAETYPRCSILGVSNSASQRTFIEAEARARGLSNLAIETADVNRFEARSRYDRVVSVEMFEHVRNHGLLLDRIAGWLESEGRLFVHVFRHQRHAYLFDTEGAHNWMGRHFFTGGMMPSANLLPSIPSRLTLEDRWDWSGVHYARTAEAWLARFDSHRDEALVVLGRTYGPAEAKRWLHRWRIFLLGCAELFAYRGGEEWGVSHYRFAPLRAARLAPEA